MDETGWRLLWIVGTGGFGAALGCAFGCVTGALHWSNGGRPGTFFAQHLAQAFQMPGEQEMSPRMRGALVGAVDGFVFLGVVGTLLGAVFAYAGRPDNQTLFYLGAGGVLLALAAVCFGLLAYAVVHNGVWAVIGLCLGGMGGGFTAALLISADHLPIGVVPGMILGTAASFLVRRYAPRFRDPHVAKRVHDHWRHAGEETQTDVFERDSDGIQKAAPSEE